MLKKTTKQYCLEALEVLLTEKPYNKISVRDIANKVGISTVTFYKYFDSKADLYYWAVHETGKLHYSRFDEDYTWYNYLYSILCLNLVNKHNIKNITKNSENYYEEKTVTFRSNLELMTEYIRSHFGQEALSEEVMTAIHVYLRGIISYMENDAKEGMKADRKKMAEYLTGAMPEILKKYIPHQINNLV